MCSFSDSRPLALWFSTPIIFDLFSILTFFFGTRQLVEDAAAAVCDEIT
jgi:hypothetical protein